jgi:hypothetical protein
MVFMHTNKQFDSSAESEDSAFADSASAKYLQLAYSRKVQELLSQSDASTWISDLWDMYTTRRYLRKRLGMIHEGTAGS